MKTYAGSLQRRGKRWYLVVSKSGRQRWFALKTDKLPIARLRAARIAPADPNEERAWLEQLVREGELARKRLARERIAAELTWENLFESISSALDCLASDGVREYHAHWLDLLARYACRRRHDCEPGTLSADDATAVAAELVCRYRSGRRMVGYFRRVWRSLGLDPSIWPSRIPPCSTYGGEHYRRLSVDEVRKVHELLSRSMPALADVVLIGYSTGLRLSDVVQLETSEINLPFLRVTPNKTRRLKPHPLRIPLTDEAMAVVVRLKSATERNESSCLFGDEVRSRPSRRIALAFRRAGVLKLGNGRASFHSLRATFISLMDEAGIPPHITDAITGHGGGGMHARYTQPSDEALLKAVRSGIPKIL